MEIEAAAALIVREKDLEAFSGVALESCTWIVMTLVPDTDGVPAIAAPARVKPVGRVPDVTDQV
jgi:hypothetical protein